jgi:hypothetical protein
VSDASREGDGGAASGASRTAAVPPGRLAYGLCAAAWRAPLGEVVTFSGSLWAASPSTVAANASSDLALTLPAAGCACT